MCLPDAQRKSLNRCISRLFLTNSSFNTSKGISLGRHVPSQINVCKYCSITDKESLIGLRQIMSLFIIVTSCLNCFLFSGEKMQTIRFPTTNITSCCWGGPNFDELYVTSAKHFLTEEQKRTQPLAGSIFRVTGLGVKGVKCEPFNDS